MLFEVSLVLKKPNMKLTKKIKRLMKNQEVESKLVLESRKNEEFDVYKLNFMSTIVFLEEDKKKLMSKRDSIIKKTKDLT